MEHPARVRACMCIHIITPPATHGGRSSPPQKSEKTHRPTPRRTTREGENEKKYTKNKKNLLNRLQCNEKTLPLHQINETNTAPGVFPVPSKFKNYVYRIDPQLQEFKKSQKYPFIFPQVTPTAPGVYSALNNLQDYENFITRHPRSLRRC